MNSTTLTEQAIAALRAAVLDGRLAPGTSVREADVCEICRVGRTPARAALVALHKEGLLDYEPQRGYWTRSFALEDILDAYAIRGAVEGLACRLIVERGLEAAVSEKLRVYVAEGSRLLSDGRRGAFDAASWRAMNTAFHRVINEAVGSPFANVSSFLQQIPLAAASVTADFRPEPDLDLIWEAQLHHEKIVKAIEAREGARAESLMREHLCNAGDILATTLADHMMRRSTAPDSSSVTKRRRARRPVDNTSRTTDSTGRPAKDAAGADSE